MASNKQVVRVNLDVDDAVRRLEIGARRLERAADALRTQREALERLLPEFTDTTTERQR